MKVKYDFSGLQVPANRAHRGGIGNRRTERGVCVLCVVGLGGGRRGVEHASALYNGRSLYVGLPSIENDHIWVCMDASELEP